MAASRRFFPQPVGDAVVRVFGFVPFVVAAWAVIAWMIWRQSLAGFFSLFIVVPLLFIQLGLMGFMLWLRPSIRTARKLPVAEGSMYLGAVATWAAGVSVPGLAGGLLQLVAIGLSAYGIWWFGQRSHKENVENLAARTEQMREHFRTQQGFPSEPRVISTDEEWVASERTRGSADAAVDAEIIDEQDEDDGPEWIATPRGE